MHSIFTYIIKWCIFSPVFFPEKKLKLKKKLDLDWKHGTHKEVTVNAPGLVQAAQIFANSGKIVCSADESIILANSKTGDRILTLSGHQAVITCVDMFSHNSK